MEISLTVPALLFPAISLLYLSYNARFLALANLIRSLFKEFIRDRNEAIYEQIQLLRRRLQLIRLMQICGASSFLLAATSMTFLFFGAPTVGHLTFGAALIALIASVGFLLRENTLSIAALELQLKSLPPKP